MTTTQQETTFDREGKGERQVRLLMPLAFAPPDTVRQLRYRAIAGPARIPDLTRAEEHAAALPSLMWPGWALRLMPASSMS